MTLSAILPRPAFRSALAAVKLAVERRNSIPVLSNVRLASVDGRIVATGTDLDVVISATIPDSSADDAFAVTLPCHMLLDVEKKAPATDLVALDMPPLASDDPSTRLDFDGLRVSMQHIAASDFPDMPFAGPVHADFVMPSATLANALARVSFAISCEATRYYLNGVNMHVMDMGNRRVLRFVATDGHRLAYHEIDAPEGVADPETHVVMAPALIPTKTVAILEKILNAKDAPDSCRVTVNTSKVRFTIGNVEVVTKLIDGTFPDYTRIIPSANNNVFSCDSTALYAAVKAVTCLSSERGRAVRFTLLDKRLRLTVINPDSGTAETEIDADYAGPEVTIGFNSGYVLDILDAADSDVIRFALADPGSPALVTDPANEDTTFVLMPMRV